MRSCETEVVKYLPLIVKNFVKCRKFTNVLKKFNVFSIHRKGNKYCFVFASRHESL